MNLHNTRKWKVGKQNGHCGISINAGQKQIATVYLNVINSDWQYGARTINRPENAEAKANAALIAAAPDLLKFVENITDAAGKYTDLNGHQIVADAYSLLAQARGKS